MLTGVVVRSRKLCERTLKIIQNIKIKFVKLVLYFPLGTKTGHSKSLVICDSGLLAVPAVLAVTFRHDTTS